MNNPANKNTKIYCERCDSIFDSRAKFEKHFDSIHLSNVSCESCPIDAFFSKLAGFFKKKQDI